MRGCNLRCPYCYNTELVEPAEASQAQDAGGDENCSQDLNAGARAGRDQPQFVGAEEILAHLKKRANVLSGFVISGGEPLCQPELVRRLVLEARSLGYKIKLDTNGIFPDRLQKLLDDPAVRPDYIALDVKTSPARYGELSQVQEKTTKDVRGKPEHDTLQAQDAAAEKVIRSIKIVSALPAEEREFRTVLYPPLVGRAEIEEIAALLPADARWYFARFQNSHCLREAAEKVQPYTDAEEAALVDLARSKISAAELR